MTTAEVRRALTRAVQEAYSQGERHGRKPRESNGDPLLRAMAYAEQLVMPMVEAAIGEAVEQTATALLQRTTDPEPPPEFWPDAPA